MPVGDCQRCKHTQGPEDNEHKNVHPSICVSIREISGKTSLVRLPTNANNHYKIRRHAMNHNRLFTRTCTNIQILRSALAWPQTRPGNRNSTRWRHQKQRNYRSKPPAERTRSQSKQQRKQDIAFPESFAGAGERVKNTTSISFAIDVCSEPSPHSRLSKYHENIAGPRSGNEN